MSVFYLSRTTSLRYVYVFLKHSTDATRTGSGTQAPAAGNKYPNY